MRTLLTLMIVLFCSQAAYAATPPPVGSWQYVGGQDELSKMEGAVEAVASELNFVIRGIARDRLRAACQPWRSLKIARSGNQITVTTDGDSTESDLGSSVRTSSAEGPLTVRRELRAGILVEIFSSKRGKRTNEYHQSGPEVRVDSVIESPRLPHPVRFSYTYR